MTAAFMKIAAMHATAAAIMIAGVECAGEKTKQNKTIAVSRYFSLHL